MSEHLALIRDLNARALHDIEHGWPAAVLDALSAYCRRPQHQAEYQAGHAAIVAKMESGNPVLASHCYRKFIKAPFAHNLLQCC